MKRSDKHGPDFYKGLDGVGPNIKEKQFFSTLYPIAKELSAKGVSLSEEKKGYVVGVGKKLMDYPGYALEGAEFLSSVGELGSSELKDSIAKALLKGAKKGDLEYQREIYGFMNSNGMKKYLPKNAQNKLNKGNALELEVVDTKNTKMREWLLSSAMILAGVLIAGFKVTGNVIGNSEFNGFVGGLFFVVGTSFLFFSLKNRR